MVSLDFNIPDEELPQARERFLEEAGKIIEAASLLESDYEKEKYVHNALLELIEYDEEAEMNQNAYGAIVDGRCVCAGYSRAFQYILNELQIPVYYVTGISQETDHAWNIVRIGGKYYNVDLTWDDQTPDRYLCFNRSDPVFAQDHERSDLARKLPACSSDRRETE
jgi:transglutaminase/protease-like cytokinesis protein 3